MGNQTATFIPSGDGIWQHLPSVVIPTLIAEDSKRRHIPSHFDPRLYPLKYANEIAVQVYVEMLVKDAIACMGCTTTLDTHLEFSFYGITPDILVVMQGRKMVFVIEVKSPNRPQRPNENSFESELVGGQIWLYLMAMCQAGNLNPLGAICTFNAIRLVSLTDMMSHLFGQALSELKSDAVQPWGMEQIQDSKGVPSPDPKRTTGSAKNKRFDYKDPAHSVKPSQARGAKVFSKAELHCSPIATDHQVFSMLLLGLKTATLEVKDTADHDTITEVNIGGDLGFRLFPYASSRKITFHRTASDLGVVKGNPGPRTKCFYLLDSIGVGGEGSVCTAASSAGNPAAIKFYNIKPSRAAHHKQRDQENKALVREVAANCEKEFILWNKLYPGQARRITLRQLPCLLMPYGKRISEDSREHALCEIRAELARFFDEGFVYNQKDLRWRHVMRNMQGRIFLADLGSLITHGEKLNNTNKRSAIKEQLKHLVSKLNEETDRKPTATGKRKQGDAF